MLARLQGSEAVRRLKYGPEDCKGYEKCQYAGYCCWRYSSHEITPTANAGFSVDPYASANRCRQSY